MFQPKVDQKKKDFRCPAPSQLCKDNVVEDPWQGFSDGETRY